MVYVIYDESQKNPIRAVWKIPEGVAYSDAEHLIRGAYRKAAEDIDGTNAQPEDYLDGTGCESLPFLTIER